MAPHPASNPPLAVVTGASAGIGLELARLCACEGHDLVIAADDGNLDAVADALRDHGVAVHAVRADLSTKAGVDKLLGAIGERPVDALLANAGHGLGHAFLEQDFDAIRRVINTNVVGTLDLIHRVGRRMQLRRRGRILITGSIAGLMPGSFQAVYSGSKAFVDSFAEALGRELESCGVTITVRMPGNALRAWLAPPVPASAT